MNVLRKNFFAYNFYKIQILILYVKIINTFHLFSSFTVNMIFISVFITNIIIIIIITRVSGNEDPT